MLVASPVAYVACISALDVGVSDLLELSLRAHGGLERWRNVQALDLRLAIRGALYEMKGFPEGLASASVRIDPLHPVVTVWPYLAGDLIGHFTADRVWIDDSLGRIVDELRSPRASFAGHALRTPWDQLQRLYFTGCALWNYLTLPFLLANFQFAMREIEPHRENGGLWRRLHVTFPPGAPVHCAEQILYFDSSGCLQHLDYEIDMADVSVAHYCDRHVIVSGLRFPTLHRVVRRSHSGPQVSGPTGLLLEIEISSVIVW